MSRPREDRLVASSTAAPSPRPSGRAVALIAAGLLLAVVAFAMLETIRFRIQAPEIFETNASIWTIVNLGFALVAAWLIRSGVHRARSVRE